MLRLVHHLGVLADVDNHVQIGRFRHQVTFLTGEINLDEVASLHLLTVGGADRLKLLVHLLSFKTEGSDLVPLTSSGDGSLEHRLLLVGGGGHGGARAGRFFVARL